MQTTTTTTNLDQQLERILNQYPDNATSWREATDGIRDLAADVREAYNDLELDVLQGEAGYVESLNFRALRTPSAWNTEAKKQIRELWSKMGDWAKQSIFS